jgi:hypothetical protein
MNTLTSTTMRLPRSLQKLVDARLDTIDRMLLGRLPRADRLSVARDVEGQIFDLLANRPGHELDREDVLTVLTQLDPPEAYIPEEGGYEAAAVLLPAASTSLARRPQTSDVTSGEKKRATIIGILGLVLLGVVVLWPAVYILAALGSFGEGAIIGLLALSLIMFVAAIPTLVLSILWRRGGAWATVGIIAGALGLVVGALSAVIVLVMG